jgi:pre-mRNA-splicing factor ATP-dependent RNA helicase DHX38/PRP16
MSAAGYPATSLHTFFKITYLTYTLNQSHTGSKIASITGLTPEEEAAAKAAAEAKAAEAEADGSQDEDGEEEEEEDDGNDGRGGATGEGGGGDWGKRKAMKKKKKSSGQFKTHLKSNQAQSEFSRNKTLGQQRRSLPVYTVREDLLQVGG